MSLRCEKDCFYYRHKTKYTSVLFLELTLSYSIFNCTKNKGYTN